ncbi:hypothetical protein MA16_Dca017946 [Dendrobium catenatum]|uniref:Uncharacterized protein n=1 Tax=Dendrobium catenatum TaxID=906689 RepID=A0A2I0X9K1_9ASPA|nr:hypothetical protein MA16_Dca017946 [Dendrobium catenatum]
MTRKLSPFRIFGPALHLRSWGLHSLSRARDSARCRARLGLLPRATPLALVRS